MGIRGETFPEFPYCPSVFTGSGSIYVAPEADILLDNDSQLGLSSFKPAILLPKMGLW